MKSKIKSFCLRWLPKVLNVFLSKRIQTYILQVMLQSEITKIREEVGSNNKPTRDAWLEQTLAKIPAGCTILDAGAGELQYKKYCPHLHYTSQDFAQYNGQGNAKGLQIGDWDNSQLDIISDITAIPVQPSTFDAVMCIEVLEHLPHPVAALREIVRVVKPGGLLIITAPFASITHFAPYYFSNGFSTYFYEHWAKEFGLIIRDLRCNGNYFDYIAQELRRLPDISSQYANEQMTDSDRVLIDALLGKLSILSEKGATSSELLTFGIHMLAEKRQ